MEVAKSTAPALRLRRVHYLKVDMDTLLPQFSTREVLGLETSSVLFWTSADMVENLLNVSEMF
ncbi:MAG: hypothetical protein GY938_10575 [Ketobacter sp.]|nr:hypothetical protein [Ketobacter sp.]